ncbi:hypothetical protein [Geitlerinema sp. PCC 7407]|uniref:hypothetical protein n=1 Tax=Geitlerinema sp. PCC 7407 TaxID=1173025 RepID=UPI00059C09A4|nr:hypothetical protein [Geitlerinema sp. PCC 7407]
MAALAALNFGLVLFDLTYISMRDFWLRGTVQVMNFTIQIPLPPITDWYDPIKGIEPYRDTEIYLETVDQLKRQVARTGLESEAVAVLLADLRDRSIAMIEDNPFLVADKTGTLEKIKNRLREHVGTESSKEAFDVFWTQTYLTREGWEDSIGYFDRRIRPLIATNYYRPLGENGELYSNFWAIDAPFVFIFLAEFLARTFYISRKHNGVSWIDAMLWRWYDIPLLLPFWRWLRIIPVTLRLDQSGLVDMDRIRSQASQGLVASIAEDLTELVAIRTINQLQSAVEQGTLTRLLTRNEAERRSYIDLNNVNEVEAVTNLLIQMLIYRVLPKVKPDIDAIVSHNIQGAVGQLPGAQLVNQLPGMDQFSAQVTNQVSAQITQTIYEAVVRGLEDPVGAELAGRLVQSFSEALGTEFQSQRTSDELQTLLVDFLEEFKVNYIARLNQEDVETLLDQTRELRQQLSAQRQAQVAARDRSSLASSD